MIPFHPLHFAVTRDFDIIKLGYFDGYNAKQLATEEAKNKNIDYIMIVNHSEIVTLCNNVDHFYEN